jgi:putative transcriptional regulator
VYCAVTVLDDSMPKDKITNNIRKLRFEHGEMTQAELAKQVGCSRQTIVLLEQGRYAPSLALAFKVACVFSKTIDNIFTFESKTQ